MRRNITAMCMPAARDGIHGQIMAPPSKSLTQRALLVAALAGPGATVINPLDAEDSRLLFQALRTAGFDLIWEAGRIIAGGRENIISGQMELGNNGTGVRFLLAQLAGLPGEWIVDGGSRLRERPIGALVNALEQLGASIEVPSCRTHDSTGERQLPLLVHGRMLEGGRVVVDATASSQYVSALLLLGCRLAQGVIVELTAPPPSRPYLDLTCEVLASFGVPVATNQDRFWQVSGGGLHPTELVVEGDWSAAAFPLAAVAVAGGEVKVVGLRQDSRQGDARIIEILQSAGCTVSWSEDGVVLAGPATRALHADLRDTPDMFPALSVIVSKLGGRLEGLAGLAAKESHRLKVMTDHLTELGFAVTAGEDFFLAPGGEGHNPDSHSGFDPARDHRIAMALAVAGTFIPGLVVTDPDCVAKSWPSFWSDWARLLGVK